MPLPGPVTRTIVWPILKFARRLSRLVPRYPLERARLSILLHYAKFTRSRLTTAKDITKENSKRKRPFIRASSVLQKLNPKLMPTDDLSQGVRTVFGKIIIRDPVNSIKFAYAADELLPAQDLIFWTDACTTKENGGAGVAVVVYERKPNQWMREAIVGNIPSSTLAEAAALVKALDIAIGFVKSGVHTDQVHVFSDDLSGLKILKGFQNTASGSWMFPILAGKVRCLQSLGVNVSLHWVRGHSGVKGNSLADHAAAQFLGEARRGPSRIPIIGRAGLESALSLSPPALRMKSDVCRQDPEVKIQHNIRALESRLRGVPLDLGSKFRKVKKCGGNGGRQAVLDQILNRRERRKARWMAIERASQRRNKKSELKTHMKSGARGCVNEVVNSAKARPDVRVSSQVVASMHSGIQCSNIHRLELGLPALKKSRRQHPALRRLELDPSALRQDSSNRSAVQHGGPG